MKALHLLYIWTASTSSPYLPRSDTMIDLNIPSPIQELDWSVAKTAGCRLFIKREDLIHPNFGGNKWRKLKYNLEEYKRGSHSHLITFGGPFSNHIAAVASICRAHNIPSVGIIRGEYKDPDNPTLQKAAEEGMQLSHISKVAYSEKEHSETFRQLLTAYERPYIVPEGGSNSFAKQGVMELMSEVYTEDMQYDYVIISAGTGMTATGIIEASRNDNILVINALRNESLEETIKNELSAPKHNWSIKSEYTFGGFARVTRELIDFINAFNESHQILLDPIYNGKAMFALGDLLKSNYFRAGSKILYIHTGGLQGITAYNYTSKSSRKILLA